MITVYYYFFHFFLVLLEHTYNLGEAKEHLEKSVCTLSKLLGIVKLIKYMQVVMLSDVSTYMHMRFSLPK